jgi:uncharacterized protein DUF2130
MEAATPLRKPHVRVVGDRLAIDGLAVQDETAVRLVREREEAGTEAAKTVTDALEIGARVLDREQAGANAEYVKTEFEKAARELDHQFADRARKVAEFFGERVEDVFGADDGRLAKEFEKLFSDGSAASVQNRVREIVTETMVKSREDLMRQFSSADGTNPLADFKAGTIRELRQAHTTQQALLDRMGDLEKQLQRLHDEKEKLEEIEAERERGTAKGRTFEELVAETVEAIALPQGDDAEAVGDVKGATGRTGDVLVAVDGCNGSPRGRIVFEAKTARLSRRAALDELDEALRERDADYAVLVVSNEEKVPARMQTLREWGGDKMVVSLDPDGSTLGLELAYRLARARVLMARSGGDGLDAGAVRGTVERAVTAMEDVRKVKSQLTGAKTSIDNAYDVLEAMAERVRGHLAEVDALLGAAGAGEDQLSLER